LIPGGTFLNDSQIEISRNMLGELNSNNIKAPKFEIAFEIGSPNSLNQGKKKKKKKIK